MNPSDVNSWSTYLEFVKGLEEAYELIKRSSLMHHSKILYRGQADSEWGLLTTLEREAGIDFRFDAYSKIVDSARRKMSCFSQKNLPFDGWDAKWNDLYRTIPNYEWMAYLRHHGFPSPLLDWSASPYVAAFFAFRNCDYRSVDKKISIYCYQEYVGKGKCGSSNEPTITTNGPWAVVHPRHAIQQSQYTVCVVEKIVKETYKEKDYESRYIVFKSHDDALKKSSNTSQDQLIKLEIPASERSKAMKSLALMNITAYSLFQTEDAMAETLGEELIGDWRDTTATLPS